MAGRALSCALLFAGLFFVRAARADDGFHTLFEEQGITVSTRDDGPADQLVFRAEGKVSGAVLHVLAVVLDDARASEWAKSADETVVLQKLDAHTDLVYARSHQTWPVSDRDLVMKRTVEVVRRGEEYRVRLACIAGGKPKVDGVVRIARCETVFVLRKLDAATTHVEYRVRAEAGGHNPTFLVRLASRSMPLETLLGLRKQLAKTRGRYEAIIRRWADEPA